jgi:hypothetical protein
MRQAATFLRSWKAYPAYKDSGIEWLRKIPSRWEKHRLRYVCYLNPSKSELRGIPAKTEVTFLPMELIGENGSLALSETRELGQVHQGYTYFCDGDASYLTLSSKALDRTQINAGFFDLISVDQRLSAS